MPLPSIDPVSAKRLLDEGAILVDIREADEHAREKIPERAFFRCPGWTRWISRSRRGSRWFSTASGAHARQRGAPRREGGWGVRGFHRRGRLEAWKTAGLPVTTDRSQPLELQRQVQIGAGALALLGTLLGLMVSPWFLAIPLFVGAGLLTAGVTGFCGMATLLLRALEQAELRPRTRLNSAHEESPMAAPRARPAWARLGLARRFLPRRRRRRLDPAVPLVYVVGVASPHVAIGTSAIAVAANAAANLATHARAGNGSGAARRYSRSSASSVPSPARRSAR